MESDYFIPCFRVRYTTPDNVLIDGLWFGPQRAKRAVAVVHGLSSSPFSLSVLVKQLTDKETAVLTFANRGLEKISKMRRAGKQKWKLVGGAHEVFTDSVFDIQGTVDFLSARGVKDIYLLGQSTGCHKSIYWASRKKKRTQNVRGIILLAPLSDYSYAVKNNKKNNLAKATKLARTLVRSGKKHELLPVSVWPELQDAQRFLSLYTPNSVEEIFTYGQPKKAPRTLRRVMLPLLTILAEKDEYGSVPAKYIADWFIRWMQNGRVVVVPKVGHSFKGAEKAVAKTVREFMKEC
jgi:pimeloyl-ACP methyl ester carboxylesterase